MKRRDAQDGQILVLFAIMLVLLCAMAAVAIDVSNVYAARRAYRSAADAAALAGAQELQQERKHAVGTGEYNKARDRARDLLGEQLGGSPDCDAVVDDTMRCTFDGTTYEATIRTPINGGDCVSCAPDRSVEVKVANPRFGLTFARVLGFNEFNVSVGAVAGLNFEKSYTIITLRPPKKLGSTFDVRDIRLSGGSVVNVDGGDVGSNANMVYDGLCPSVTIMNISSGYHLYYVPAAPPDDDPGWSQACGPVALPIDPIQDPGYRYPSMTGTLVPLRPDAPTFDDARPSEYATLPAVERADEADGLCAAEVAKVDVTRYTFMAGRDPATIYCYNPGIYSSGSGARNARIQAPTGTVALLKPGAYYLKSGLSVNGWLIGGYEPGLPGVALMFDPHGPARSADDGFDGTSGQVIALNAGDRFPPSYSGGAPATAAIDWSGQAVDTSGVPNGPDTPLLITLLVKWDSTCYVPSSGTFVEPSACETNRNQTLNMAGGGSLALEGVQYAPSDNITITGGSAGNGRVGQIVSWTLHYAGGTDINQQGPNTESLGLLRLDGACTAPGTPCAP